MYLGTGSTQPIRDRMADRTIGQLCTPDSGNKVVPGALWAADNACFAGNFDETKWLRWLDRQPREDCLFAVAPDVVGDAVATWERSSPWLPKLRAMGFRAALVAQDGIESLAVEWDAFDVLFIGGSTEWKLSHHAFEIAREARARGKHVHVGRVNSFSRYRAWAPFADSCDGTYLAFGPDTNLPKLLAWLTKHEGAPTLWEAS